MGAPTTNIFEGRLTIANLVNVATLIKEVLGNGETFLVTHEQSIGDSVRHSEPGLHIEIGYQCSEDSSDNYELSDNDVEVFSDGFRIDWLHLNLEVGTMIKDDTDLPDTQYPHLAISMEQIVIQEDIFNTWTISRT